MFLLNKSDVYVFKFVEEHKNLIGLALGSKS
jgi:hypothetical protein